DIEPEVNNRVAHLLDKPDVNSAILVSNLEITLRWSCPESRAEILTPIVAKAKTILGDLIFSNGPDLATTIIQELTESGSTIATAESCTGGLIADMLTDVPGSSSVLRASYVTYSPAAKIELGVPSDLINRHGIVSEAVALSMAESATARSRVSYSVAVTGVAGPGPDADGNEAGTVWLGIKGNGVHKAIRLQIPGTRRVVKQRAAKCALYYLHHLHKHARLPVGFFMEHRGD
ncbi:MAG: CinA family protein, partial [Planctomycetota bacterium]